MSERMAGDYIVQNSVNLNGVDVIFGEYINNDNKSPRYMCGFCVNGPYSQSFKDCVASDSYVDVMREYANRILQRTTIDKPDMMNDAYEKKSEAFYKKQKKMINKRTIYGKSFKCDLVDLPVCLAATFEKKNAWLVPDTSNLDLSDNNDVQQLIKARYDCACYGFNHCKNADDYNSILDKLGGTAENAKICKQQQKHMAYSR